MKILLTGSSGFIGNNFLNYINNNNHNILAIYNTKKPKLEKKNSNISFLKYDLKKKIPKKIIKFKPDVVFHLAWQGIPSFDFLNSELNLKNSYIFLKSLIEQANIKKLIISGSCFEHYNLEHKEQFEKYKYFIYAKKNLYYLLKHICLEKKISLGWFRIFFVYGKGQRKNSLIPYIIRSFKNRETLKILNINDKNDYIHVDDVSNLFLIAIKKKFKSDIYDLGSGKLTSVHQILKIIKKKMSLDKFAIQTKKKNYKKISKKYLRANMIKVSKTFDWSTKLNIYEGIEKIIPSQKK